VVIDFGLAAVPGMTTTGLSGQATVGTPAFMAPEQLAGTRVTAAADVWSWAVTMVFAGTGELPFKGESLTATAFAILQSEPNVGRLPEPLGSLVQRCLNKDPAGRPSARGVLGDLVAAGARLVGPMPPMASPLAADEEAASSQRVRAALSEPPQGNSDGLIAGRPAGRPRSARHGSRPSWRRRRAPVILAAILLVASLGVLAFNLPRRGAPSEQLTDSNQELTAVAVARTKAVNWILQQVSRAVIVSCDSQVCTDLANRGFPAANLLTLGPMSTDPLGSKLVIATAAIRAQFGRRLFSVYAPATIASFGSGDARIEIQLVFASGTVKYNEVQRAALRARKTADAQLLTNSNIAASPMARAQLLSGDIDPLLPILLAGMAASHPVYIVDFVNQSPGGGSASLLRTVDLATAVRTAHLTSAAYLNWMQVFIDAQTAEYLPGWVREVTLPTGQAVLRVGYGAPSPLS
jgi:protein kinase-like protein